MLFEAGAGMFLKRRVGGAGTVNITSGDIGGVVALTSGADLIQLPNSTEVASWWSRANYVGCVWIVHEVTVQKDIDFSVDGGLVNNTDRGPHTKAGGSNKLILCYPSGTTQWVVRGVGMKG
jgi:hypothetical protein